MTKGSLFALLYANHREIYMCRSVFLSRMISSYPRLVSYLTYSQGCSWTSDLPTLHLQGQNLLLCVCGTHAFYQSLLCQKKKKQQTNKEDYIFTYLFQTCVRKKKSRGSRYESAWNLQSESHSKNAVCKREVSGREVTILRIPAEEIKFRAASTVQLAGMVL